MSDAIDTVKKYTRPNSPGRFQAAAMMRDHKLINTDEYLNLCYPADDHKKHIEMHAELLKNSYAPVTIPLATLQAMATYPLAHADLFDQDYDLDDELDKLFGAAPAEEAKAVTCECGSYKRFKAGPGMPGHSDWCEWSVGKWTGPVADVRGK